MVFGSARMKQTTEKRATTVCFILYISSSFFFRWFSFRVSCFVYRISAAIVSNFPTSVLIFRFIFFFLSVYCLVFGELKFRQRVRERRAFQQNHQHDASAPNVNVWKNWSAKSKSQPDEIHEHLLRILTETRIQYISAYIFFSSFLKWHDKWRNRSTQNNRRNEVKQATNPQTHRAERMASAQNIRKNEWQRKRKVSKRNTQNRRLSVEDAWRIRAWIKRAKKKKMNTKTVSEPSECVCVCIIVILYCVFMRNENFVWLSRFSLEKWNKNECFILWESRRKEKWIWNSLASSSYRCDARMQCARSVDRWCCGRERERNGQFFVSLVRFEVTDTIKLKF